MSVLSLSFKKPLTFIVLFLLGLLEAVFIVFLPLLIGQLFQTAAALDWRMLLIIMLLVVAGTVFYWLVSLFQIFIEARYYAGIRKLIRRHICQNIVEKDPLKVFSEQHSYLSLFTNDVDTITLGIKSILSLVNDVAVIVSSAIIITIVSPLLTLSMTIIFVFFSAIPFLFRNKIKKLGIQHLESRREHIGVVKNMLDGYAIFRMGRSSGFVDVYTGSIRKTLTNIFKKYLHLLRYHFLSGIFVNISPFFILTASSFFLFLGYINVGMFASSILYVGHISNVIENSVRKLNEILVAREALKKIVVKKTVVKKTKIDEFALINIKNISFSFENMPLFKNFNFKIESGKKYAITGKSGCGKSTLIDLMLGLLTPDSGKIFWNNTNITQINTEELLEYVHFISTVETVFEDSLQNNLTVFNENVTDDQLQEAIKLLKLEHIQLNQRVSVKNISAGEIQRILLAKTIIQPRKILILDEALSNLDVENRKRIEDYFLTKPNLTFVHITHHLEEGYFDKYDFVLELDQKR